MDGSDNGLSLRKPDTGQYVAASTGIGKTFVACALGNQAAREGYGVFYTRLTRLLDDLPGWTTSRRRGLAPEPAL